MLWDLTFIGINASLGHQDLHHQDLHRQDLHRLLYRTRGKQKLGRLRTFFKIST